MGLLKSIRKRYHRCKNIKFDHRIGFFKYKRWGNQIFIRHPRHYVDYQESEWVCKNIYFKYYLPQNGDTVLDFGAGYSEEGVFLSNISRKTRYLGVEIQPVMYECLCNTYEALGSLYQAIPYAVSNSAEKLKVSSQFSYASSGVTKSGYIEVPTISWDSLIDRYEITQIDLLKMNIEGAEAILLAQVSDFSIIKRAVISCHDFRAEEGAGDSFKTKEKVIKILEENGFILKSFNYSIGWADDWVYGERA